MTKPAEGRTRLQAILAQIKAEAGDHPATAQRLLQAAAARDPALLQAMVAPWLPGIAAALIAGKGAPGPIPPAAPAEEPRPAAAPAPAEPPRATSARQAATMRMLAEAYKRRKS